MLCVLLRVLSSSFISFSEISSNYSPFSKKKMKMVAPREKLVCYCVSMVISTIDFSFLFPIFFNKLTFFEGKNVGGDSWWKIGVLLCLYVYFRNRLFVFPQNFFNYFSNFLHIFYNFHHSSNPQHQKELFIRTTENFIRRYIPHKNFSL